MSKVTVKDLEGLLSAIDIVSDLVEAGAEDPHFLEDAEGAFNCRLWLLKEIVRRKRQKKYRQALKQAKAALSETATRED